MPRNWGGYPEYVSVAEKQAKAAKMLKRLQKKMPDIRPVVLRGSALADSWWGKSWNKNLERYADYSNRIGRGRSYVRHGAVLDLQIANGAVKGLVLGSETKPYEVTISIKALGVSQWSAIKKRCAGRLKSLQELLAGKFPKELQDIFLAEGKGLFPSPQEIQFNCSCPDWASMCKHVAAVFYGIGARLDQDPSLFFTLRNVRSDELVTEAIQDKTKNLLAKAGRNRTHVLAEADLSALFGIELDTPSAVHQENVEVVPKGMPKAAVKKSTVKAGTHNHSQASQEKSVALSSAPQSPMDQIAACIARQKSGVNADTLADQTGLPKTKVYALVHRLKQQGKIKNKAHGIYVKT